MKKKILSLMLILSIWFSLIPTLSLSVNAAMVNQTPEIPSYTVPPRNAEDVEVRLAELIDKYNNTYWTSTGEPCSSHRENCYSKYFNAWQCNGFARYIFNELFCGGDIGSYDGNNPYYLPNPRNAIEVANVAYVEKDDTATIQAILTQAQPGDFLQIYDRETTRPHSMIVASVTNKGIYVLDCNSDGHCGVMHHLLTWKTMAARYERLSLYHSAVYPAPANPFTDVSDNDWFCGPVVWAVENGITKGVSPTEFSPYKTCTRAEVVTFLYAAAGKPKVNTTQSPFVDVKRTDWYFEPVMWAVENGITNGTDATHFSPYDPCTRAAVVTFLYAAKDRPAVEGESSFYDVSSSDWYLNPVLWAAQNNVTSGYADGGFGPLRPCTRAEVVTFLMKVYG